MKVKALLYCTKNGGDLVYFGYGNREYRCMTKKNQDYIFNVEGFNPNDISHCLNGTIPCECEIEVEEIYCDSLSNGVGYDFYYYTDTITDVREKSCLDEWQLQSYLGAGIVGEKVGYALHISNLKVFDEPRKLSEYVYRTCLYGNCSTCKHYETANCSAMQFPIKKAPQNMMCAFECIGDGGYINLDEVSKEPYILISIQPQWLCKILNGEKDIEIRKQVLNCMKGE